MNTKHKIESVARLALADGSIYSGSPFGATGQSVCQAAELVFNTAMTGYQESLSDPSYSGQILIQTTPMIGNTGVNDQDLESNAIQVSGFVVHELPENHSNYRAQSTLAQALHQAGVLAIAGLDTRSLTRHLRTQGVVQAVLTDRTDISDAELVQIAKTAAPMLGQDLASTAAATAESPWSQSLGPFSQIEETQIDEDAPTALLIDCGFKHNIARNLTARGIKTQLVPPSITASDIKSRFQSGQAQALFVSNGPGDPQAVEQVIHTLTELLNDDSLKEFPIFGICLGNQLLALALGAKTFKLPFGHRGANHPILNLLSGRVEITSQNHGFAVDQESLEAVGGRVTHVHLNDSTVAGFSLEHRPVRAVQFHPEASPGPHDSNGFFDDFARLMIPSSVR